MLFGIENSFRNGKFSFFNNPKNYYKNGSSDTVLKIQSKYEQLDIEKLNMKYVLYQIKNFYFKHTA